MKVSHVLNCQFGNWYDLHRSWTIKSVRIPISERFVEYLNADGIVLPRNIDERALPDSRRNALPEDVTGFDEDWEGESISSSETGRVDEDGEEQWILDEIPQIESAIHLLGGSVFPKLNWSSPRDAAWISCGETLQCSSVMDILLLMKSSDFVAHDLDRAFERCEDAAGRTRPEKFYLVLRQWADLNPSREFRCFVLNRRLRGISQRDHTNFYVHLNECTYQLRLQEVLVSFFQRRIQNSFPDESFVFDVYVDQENEVYLIDFNPFGRVTDALLFDWDELLEDADRTNNVDGDPLLDCHFEVRIVQAQSAMGPSLAMSSRLPRELREIDLSTAQGINAFAASFEYRMKDQRMNE